MTIEESLDRTEEMSCGGDETRKGNHFCGPCPSKQPCSVRLLSGTWVYWLGHWFYLVCGGPRTLVLFSVWWFWQGHWFYLVCDGPRTLILSGGGGPTG